MLAECHDREDTQHPLTVGCSTLKLSFELFKAWLGLLFHRAHMMVKTSNDFPLNLFLVGGSEAGPWDKLGVLRAIDFVLPNFY